MQWWPRVPVYCLHVLGIAVLLLDKPYVFIAMPVPTCSDAPQCLVPSCRHSPELSETLRAAQRLAKWHKHTHTAISRGNLSYFLLGRKLSGGELRTWRTRWPSFTTTTTTTNATTPLACVCLSMPIACTQAAGVCLCLHPKSRGFREAKIAVAAELNSLFQKLFSSSSPPFWLSSPGPCIFRCGASDTQTDGQTDRRTDGEAEKDGRGLLNMSL